MLLSEEGDIGVPSRLGSTRSFSFHFLPCARRHSFCALRIVRSSSQATGSSGTTLALPFFGGYSMRLLSSSASMVLLHVDESLVEVEVRPAEACDLPDTEAGEAGEHAGGVDLEAPGANDDAGDSLHAPDRAHLGPQRRRVLHPLGRVGCQQLLVDRPVVSGLGHRVVVGDRRLGQRGLPIPPHLR